MMGRLESILRERFPVSQTARHRVLLRPPAPCRVIVARAKLDETRTTLEVPSCILPRIGHAGGFMQHIAVRIVIVSVDLAAATVGQADNRTQAVEQVVVLAATAWQALVHQQATGTARVVGGAAAILLIA